MAVIINELEIVVESREEPAAEAPQPHPAAAAPPLAPLDLSDVLDRRTRMDARTLAH